MVVHDWFLMGVALFIWATMLLQLVIVGFKARIRGDDALSAAWVELRSWRVQLGIMFGVLWFARSLIA